MPKLNTNTQFVKGQHNLKLCFFLYVADPAALNNVLET